MREPQRQCGRDDRFQLVHIAERSERAVQQVLDRPVKRAAERPGVAGQRASHGDGDRQPQPGRGGQVTHR